MTFFGERGAVRPWLPTDAHDDHGGMLTTTMAMVTATAAHESPLVMLIPLAMLALGAVFAGVAFRHWFIGGGYSDFWRNSLFLGQENNILEEHGARSGSVSLSPTLFMIFGLLIAYLLLCRR